MIDVLLIDDDATTLATIGRLLTLEQYQVASAATGAEGVAVASKVSPAAAIIDLHLPDISGLMVLQQIRQQSPGTSCIILTGFGTCRATVEAMRWGALDFFEKPVPIDELMNALARACAKSSETSSDTPASSQLLAETHALNRWARLITDVVTSESDIRTVEEWGRHVNLSASGLRNRCAAAGQPVHQTLLFARVLRAIVRAKGSSVSPETLLDIVDSRTVSKVLRVSGGASGRLPVSVADFIATQRLIIDDLPLRVIAAALNRLSGLDSLSSGQMLSG
jgi:FixJ family two-component response regulator